jgi:hypothetical protein
LSVLQGNSCSITQKSGEIWTVQTDLQQIYPKSDRLQDTVYQQLWEFFSRGETKTGRPPFSGDLPVAD